MFEYLVEHLPGVSILCGDRGYFSRKNYRLQKGDNIPFTMENVPGKSKGVPSCAAVVRTEFLGFEIQ